MSTTGNPFGMSNTRAQAATQLPNFAQLFTADPTYQNYMGLMKQYNQLSAAVGQGNSPFNLQDFRAAGTAFQQALVPYAQQLRQQEEQQMLSQQNIAAQYNAQQNTAAGMLQGTQQTPMQQAASAQPAYSTALPTSLPPSSQQSPYSNIYGSPQLQSAINSRYGGNQNVIPLEGRFGLVRLAKGGDVSKSRQLLNRFAYGGLVSPQPEWFLSSEDADTQKRMQDQAKAYEDQATAYNTALQKYGTEVYDPYISQIEAYNNAVAAFNAGPRTSPFGMSVPTAPAPFSMTAPTLPFTEEQAKQTTADIQKRADEQYLGRAAGLEVMLDPKKYNLGIRSIFDSPTRRFNQGGEASVEEFIKKNVSRGTASPEIHGVSSLKGYGEGEEAASIRRSAREALRGLVGMRPYEETNPSEAYRIASTATPLTMIGGGIRGMKKIAGSEEAAKAIGKAAEAAGMKAPVTAAKSLTTLDDFHLSLGDQIRKRSADMQDLIESTPFKYNIGDRVFTADSARKNRPPLEILNRVMVGNDPMREGHPILGKVIKDPETGKTKRTPYEPGYEVLLFEDKDNWTKFRIPESAIKGVIDPIEPLEKQDGGEVTTDDFIKKNVSRGTSEVPEVDSKGNLVDEREEIRSESRRMLNRLQSQPSKLPPGIRRTVAATREQGKESMFPVAAPARDFLSGIIGASPTAPGSEAYRTGQALANMPPVQAAAAIPAKIAASAGDAATALAAMGPVMGGVVKRKGGNWLANAISDEMQNLKLDRFGNDPVDIYEGMRSVYTPEAMSRLSPETLQQVKEGFAALKPQVAINKWIDTKLAKYMQNEFATPEDPVRALIERGISPARNPGDINPIYDYNNVFEKRKKAGFPVEGLAETEAGRNWEEMADSSVNVSSLKDLLNSLKDRQESKYGMIRNEANRTLRDNPWLNKLTLPDTPIYGALGSNYRPVFNHVIDELQNAMATNSGLPKNLQLDPDDLSKMNVPQVVELVDKINKWRVDNIKNLQLEETLKADLYKAYPEQKYRWVQLNRPGQFAAESDAMGHSVRGYEPPDKGGSDYYGLGGFKAIQSGEAKVYSLRDEKGQPHVTIEVSAAPGAMSPSEFYHSDLATQSLFDRLDKVDEATIKKDKSSWWEKVVRESPEYQEYIKNIPAKVTQIKGKGNEAPAKKYWAFAQDFVKSGNWSDVQDLKNIGLRKTSSVFNEADIAKLKAMGEEVPNYVSGRDILRLQDLVIPEGKRLKYDDAGNIIGYQDERFTRYLGFKKGGPVNVPRGTSTSKQQLDKLAQISQRKKA